MRFIGDTHGKFDRYEAIAKEADASIQVGDFGMGFRDAPAMSDAHRFIRGNHDNPALCRQSPNWIPDATVERRMFFLGGGYSLDRFERIEGRDWWADEELDMGELYAAMDIYQESSADIVITHECPSDIAPFLFSDRKMRLNNPSRTSQALSSILWIRRPTLWIFGHWHIPVDREIDGCRFICLSELQHIDIDV
jgi:predicted phosphodiesterase